ncbi:aspartate ammonia-lyase [Oceanidesulfovibrio marinus]|uniref:Aspartate ammonia-lyase n=1 Tax=Oceanidesulfovibrio marinus TaxID=370038 RepID=A0A6P1ZCX7_9BACT|nr:aspartate ammonia-lyase [Oceanidesulfovibrio marinus]TVM31840.1 aspartate ammonia-lyase [Oceanidesulfovibrio marinus]
MHERTERDALGERTLPQGAYHGIHTLRALENFPISGRRWPDAFITALAQVKLACARTNLALGYLDQDVGRAICQACEEMAEGELHEHILVDPFQGGAGTSTNMNVNEVLANRAAELRGGAPGDSSLIHPLEHVNRHQSTNDVFPTALAVACLSLLKKLEEAVADLQQSLQYKEQELSDVLCLGRTQLQDALPMTMGMTIGAFAEAAARDRWRIFKCRERLKQVNLGGTAMGTGLAAPRDYIFRVVEELKQVTGLPVSRAENLVDATQNMDRFVEVSGILSACAANLLKMCGDLRLLSSGPDGGLGELRLPPLQAGSSHMPGKINPVMPEAASQAALRVMAAHQCLAMAVGSGTLGLNQFMPLIASEILESLTLLTNVIPLLNDKCIRGLTANNEHCRTNLGASRALATALTPLLGYAVVERIVEHARTKDLTIEQACLELGLAEPESLRRLISPGRMRKLGFTSEDFEGFNIP